MPNYLHAHKRLIHLSDAAGVLENIVPLILPKSWAYHSSCLGASLLAKTNNFPVSHCGPRIPLPAAPPPPD